EAYDLDDVEVQVIVGQKVRGIGLLGLNEEKLQLTPYNLEAGTAASIGSLIHRLGQYATQYQRGVKRDHEGSPDEAKKRKVQENIPTQTQFFLPSNSNTWQDFLMESNKRFFCGREGDTATNRIPIVLHHPVFAQFVDDCETQIPNIDDNRLTQALSNSMRNLFKNGEERAKCVRELADKYDIPLVVAEAGGVTLLTNDKEAERGYTYIIVSVTNEIQLGGFDPYRLSGLHHGVSLKILGERNDPLKILPCLHLIVAGPYIMFAGSIITSTPDDLSTPCLSLEVLDMIHPLFWHPSDKKSFRSTARRLGAFKKAAKALQMYYLHSDHNLDADPLFPYITQYTPFPSSTNPNPHPLEFKYLEKLPHSRLLFRCKEVQSNKILAIKFVTSYSKEAHLHCAKRHCAPKLYGIEKLPGSFYMVIMEYLDPRYYTSLSSLVDKSRIQLEAKHHVVNLHQEGYVHGNIHDSNLLISTDVDATNRVMLLDFDWAGKIGETRYPINAGEKLEGLARAQGVKGGESG
ncbi:hypothetical protein FRC02_011496, partial [Tulasnella sp. 418]